MTRLWVLPWFLLMALGMGRAWAEMPVEIETVEVLDFPIRNEPFFGTPRAAAVLQNPGGALISVKGAADTFSPAVEQLFDLVNGDQFMGSSFSLWNYAPNAIQIASLRAGMGVDAGIKPYGEIQLDVPGITQRFIAPIIPTTVKGFLTAGLLDGVWKLAGKYSHAGAFVGWDLESDDNNDDHRGVMAGFSVGAHW